MENRAAVSLSSFRTYLDRYAFQERLIEAPVSPNLGLVIVIPAYKEPDIYPTLQSLAQCATPICDVEVYVIINEPEGASEEISESNRRCLEICESWKSKAFQLYPILRVFPAKKHGVGMARKVGMDEAIRRFYEIENPRGVIACFDADSTCAPSYLVEIERHFQQSETPGASIYYEHPIKAEDLPIVEYELHLRYFVHAQRWAGFTSFQTVGSSMAVRADAYVKQGGMNTRKAGEDFYFLNRIIQLGNFTEIRDTTVYPSSRLSDRVPFGTGRAMLERQQSRQEHRTYHPQSFDQLAQLLPLVAKQPSFEQLVEQCPPVVAEFLELHFRDQYQRLIKGTKSKTSFLKGFAASFDAFTIMKYVHFARTYFPDIAVTEASSVLLSKRKIAYANKKAQTLLEVYRTLDGS